MGRQLGRFLKTMGAASGVAPTLATVPATVVTIGALLPPAA
jgi:hypothetical protein